MRAALLLPALSLASVAAASSDGFQASNELAHLDKRTWGWFCWYGWCDNGYTSSGSTGSASIASVSSVSVKSAASAASALSVAYVASAASQASVASVSAASVAKAASLAAAPVGPSASAAAPAVSSAAPLVTSGYNYQTWTGSLGSGCASVYTYQTYKYTCNGQQFTDLYSALAYSCNSQRNLCNAAATWTWWNWWGFSYDDCTRQYTNCIAKASGTGTSASGSGSVAANSVSAISVASIASKASAASIASKASGASVASVASKASLVNVQPAPSAASIGAGSVASVVAAASNAAAASVAAAAAASASAAAVASNAAAASIAAAASKAGAASVAGAAAASVAAAGAAAASASAASSAAAAGAAASAAAGAASASAAAASIAAASVAAAAAAKASASAAAAIPASVIVSGSIPSGWALASGAIVSDLHQSGARVLVGSQGDSGSMTPAFCISECAGRGFLLAGLENGGECFCGNSLVNGGSVGTTTANAVKPCNGDASLTCGSASGLQLYRNTAALDGSLQPIAGYTAPVASGSSTGSGSQDPTGINVGSFTTANGYTTNGDCVAEINGRLLKGASFQSNEMTYGLCTKYCADAGYPVAGVEFGRECYCDDKISVTIPSTQCTSPCTGDNSKICGGGQAMVIFTASAVGPTTAPLANGWKAAKVCLAEKADERTFNGASYTDNEGMTQEACTNFCQKEGFTQAGVEYGTQCFCDSGVDLAAAAKSTQCNMPCSGAQTQLCGGGNALWVFTQ